MFPQHNTFLLIANQHHSTPDPPEPFIHLSLALICCSISLCCLLLQAALVTPHHHIIWTLPLLLRLMTLQTFPYTDITTIPHILHVIEGNTTSPLVHYPISVSRTWILSFQHQLSHPVFMWISVYPITSSRTQSDRHSLLQANIHCQHPTYTFSLPQHLLATATYLFITSSMITVHYSCLHNSRHETFHFEKKKMSRELNISVNFA